MSSPTTFRGFAVHDNAKWSETKLIEYTPKPFGPRDIDVEIDACSVCGSDIHTVRDDWKKPNNVMPVIVGHEIIGRVVRIGSEATTGLKLGDRVGVGAQAWACLECDLCKSGNETYCDRLRHTYNARYDDGSETQGGYALHVRVHEYFVFKIPAALETNTTAPMLCAGITVFSPLKRNGCGKGSRVGVVGLGGLGSFAIMFAKAMGAEVYAISRNDKKKEDAFKLGADKYITTDTADWNKDYKYGLDLIICTANSTENFDLNKYLQLLTVGGKWVSVGIPDKPFEVSPRTFMGNACFMGASHLGSRHEMQEMLQLAADKNLKGWVETLPISVAGIKEALERAHNNDVRYRFTLTDFDKAFGEHVKL
ncbi:hypothetical protein BABINDRAFT_159930 [Babjeviella inositovora NRRL Y-12698]|uniref:alcohol dehydrogenase (NADP(+)) n=1 Tax=Babjeviella inositovora NRRL Y-12698 TaxID=984486 RepID=A0A1E3QVI7_9ASCO|nr:uncharacterized protein BABINDRAFT_159930 [Babjeviella inositovora NRRL Y-12698]ODQ81670.1 hypothetical protein BABINDRAFT_159930 [Babjeviella inositovora NRRL Y-12698]